MMDIGIRRRCGRKWCVRVVPEKEATVEWECPKCWHRWEDQILIGPRGFRKPLNAGMVAKFAQYWSKNNGGANTCCPKCEKGVRK